MLRYTGTDSNKGGIFGTHSSKKKTQQTKWPGKPLKWAFNLHFLRIMYACFAIKQKKSSAFCFPLKKSRENGHKNEHRRLRSYRHQPH
jgi:hypothetical protein